MTNGDKLFEDPSDRMEFGVSVYGRVRGSVAFKQAVSIVQPSTIDGSLVHDGSGDSPGIKFPDGNWDRRPHGERIVTITDGTLADWVRLFDPPGTPARQSRLLRPLTNGDLATLAAFAHQSVRLADRTRHWTVGFNEKLQKDDGTIEWNTKTPADLGAVILQGPHILNATPFGQNPRLVVKSNNDWDPIDIEAVKPGHVPRTNYHPSVSTKEYRRRARKWDGEPFFDQVREAHREFVEVKSARTLQAVLLPPGPAHLGALCSIAVDDPWTTTIWAGLLASLPYDGIIKTVGVGHIKKYVTDRLPLPHMSDDLASELVHRTLRLNCLTAAYADHWADLHRPGWDEAIRSVGDRALPSTTAVWTVDVPARRSLDRWGLLCDLDAIAAVALGISEDQVVQMYRSTFPVLLKNESSMVFDTEGRQIAMHRDAWDGKQLAFEEDLKESNKVAGRGKQQDKLWDRVVANRDGDTTGNLDYLVPPFRRADRELAMRTAYRHFAELAGDTSGVSDAPLGDWEFWG